MLFPQKTSQGPRVNCLPIYGDWGKRGFYILACHINLTVRFSGSDSCLTDEKKLNLEFWNYYNRKYLVFHDKSREGRAARSACLVARFGVLMGIHRVQGLTYLGLAVAAKYFTGKCTFA